MGDYVNNKSEPLFDPDEDKDLTESEKWHLAFAAVDKHNDERPAVDKGARNWLITLALLTIIVLFIIWWFSN